MAGSLARASAVMASGTMVSRVLGFAKAMLLVYAIGQAPSVSGDAFANGNLLPNTLYMILLGGMLNAVLVPQIVKAAKDPDGGAGYINKVLTLVMSALTAVTVLVMLAAPAIVWIFTIEWGADQRGLALAFAYWALPQIIFYGLYTILGEVLNARSVFGPFTWAPVLNNVIAIAGIIVFIAMYGADSTGTRTPGDWSAGAIAVLAGSATLGVILQSVVLFVSWRKAGIRFRPDFKWRGMGLGQTGRIAGWSLATIVVMQLGGIVTQNVINTASGAGASALAMQNAWLIFMLPHSVIAVSLATAYFTRLAGWGQNGRMTEFLLDFSASARQILLVMVLASVMIFAAAPFVSRVFNFAGNPDQIYTFTLVLQCYMVGLAAYSFLFIVQRAFYALSDTRTPFIFTSVQIGLLVVLSLCLLVLPKAWVGPAYGLIFGFTTVVQALLAVFLLRKRLGHIDGSRILASLLFYTLAGIPALLVGFGLTLVFGLVFPGYGVFAAVGLAILDALVVTAVYIGVLRILKSPDLTELTAFVSRKLGRNRS
ncbi:MOP family protein [Leucobacter sp. OLJS4]|uniref:murein biosynthesis integral membrane protein MurJ n=1 Tax=unclassified Leucobacter TaxID=2621730 RepID=UPI000C1855B6|nr:MULTISPECIES: lipid II flippase MurJ [unclassified Leucobacter]PII87198.1 MOP family protein [Leucobacter sp. OLCALW19]PII87673.1 MOP family protein [Leucobacter sp. OLTLW20]PII90396.1 MOP family protein [Leucobacter sp. OLAS13]PII97430.1 MOP family protein [Leucobacter sp. OLDS2]PIJ01084.1 MOP family protein [Leucobacter sp. OLCS4]